MISFAHGFIQIQIIDYCETFSPIVKIAWLRTMNALATDYNVLHIHQMDVKTTFLNGTLNEKNYMF